MTIEFDNFSKSSKGGTEIIKYGLQDRLPPELLSKFQIVTDRFEELNETKIRLYWCHLDPDQNEQGSSWLGVDPIEELVHEGNTISDIWEHHVIRVNPIPSLALHVQFEKQRDPHINHLDWWNKYSRIYKFEVNYV